MRMAGKLQSAGGKPRSSNGGRVWRHTRALSDKCPLEEGLCWSLKNSKTLPNSSRAMPVSLSPRLLIFAALRHGEMVARSTEKTGSSGSSITPSWPNGGCPTTLPQKDWKPAMSSRERRLIGSWAEKPTDWRYPSRKDSGMGARGVQPKEWNQEGSTATSKDSSASARSSSASGTARPIDDSRASKAPCKGGGETRRMVAPRNNVKTLGWAEKIADSSLLTNGSLGSCRPSLVDSVALSTAQYSSRARLGSRMIVR